MKLTTTNRQEVEEVPYGVYVWEITDSDGSKKILGDGSNFMLIFSTKGDRAKIKQLMDAAKSYGYPDGNAVFWSGKRPISDEEYEEQLMRERLGLVPDPLDLGALRDEARAARNDNR